MKRGHINVKSLDTCLCTWRCIFDNSSLFLKSEYRETVWQSCKICYS